MEVKRHWLGQKWYLPGAAGNEINKAGPRALSNTQPTEDKALLPRPMYQMGG